MNYPQWVSRAWCHKNFSYLALLERPWNSEKFYENTIASIFAVFKLSRIKDLWIEGVNPSNLKNIAKTGKHSLSNHELLFLFIFFILNYHHKYKQLKEKQIRITLAETA